MGNFTRTIKLVLLTVFVACSGSFCGAQGLVAANTATNTIYVAKPSAGTVLAINGSTNSVIATIPVGNSPTEVLANPNTNTIYVLNGQNNSTPSTQSISVIDGGSNAVTATLTIENGTTPTQGMAIDLVSNQLYLAANNYSEAEEVIAYVYELDLATNKFTNVYYVDTEDSSELLQGIGVDSTTNTIYVTQESNIGGVISVLDANNGNLLATLSGDTRSLAVDSTSNDVYIGNTGNSSMLVVNGTTEVATLNNGSGGSVSFPSPAVNETTTEVYLPNVSTISVFNGSNNTFAATIQATGSVGVNSATNTIYAFNPSTSVLSVIDGYTNFVTAAVPL